MQSHTTRSRHVLHLLLVFTLVAGLLPASAWMVGSASAAGGEASGLVVSWSADRSRAVPLGAAALPASGQAFVFLATPATNVREVWFHLDDPKMAARPYNVEKSAPYDLVGGTATVAKPFWLEDLGAGPHTLTARVRYRNGTTAVHQATFSVGGSVVATTTTTTPSTTTASTTTSTTTTSTSTTTTSTTTSTSTTTTTTTRPPATTTSTTSTTTSTLPPQPSGTTTTTTTAPPPATLPVARDPFLWPFSSTSPWNMPIGSGATFSGASSAQTQNLIAPSVPAWINAAEYSHPVYRASTADPLVRVDWRYGTVSPWVNGSSTFRIPAAAQAAPGVDAHLHVVDPDGVTLRETFELAGTGDVRTAGKYAVFDLRGSGIGTTPGTNSGTRAYGGSSLGGLIRTWELDAGSIRHVLALALTNGQLRDGYVWPATSQDTWGAAYAGLVPMGALVAIPPTVDLTSLGLSPAGLTVARALQDYGAYVVDRSASFTLYAEPSAESRLAAARADMPRIRALLQVVTNNGPSSVGGGGTPRRPLAPVL